MKKVSAQAAQAADCAAEMQVEILTDLTRTQGWDRVVPGALGACECRPVVAGCNGG